MERVCDAFVQAIERANGLGVDVFELHMAHGNLVSEFLSPIANQRDDKYGGLIKIGCAILWKSFPLSAMPGQKTRPWGFGFPLQIGKSWVGHLMIQSCVRVY